MLDDEELDYTDSNKIFFDRLLVDSRDFLFHKKIKSLRRFDLENKIEEFKVQIQNENPSDEVDIYREPWKTTLDDKIIDFTSKDDFIFATYESYDNQCKVMGGPKRQHSV